MLMVALDSQGKNVGIDTEAIKATAIKDLLDLVDSVRGKKALVLDRTLTGPIGLLVKFSLLKDHGIDKVYHLEPDAAQLVVNHDKVIYLLRPSQKNAEIITGSTASLFALSPSLTWLVDHVKAKPAEPYLTQREIHVSFIPKRTSTCVHVLEKRGVLGDIILGDLPLLFLPLERDLLSLELESSFKELYFVVPAL